MKKGLIFSAIIVISAFGLAKCGGDGSNSASNPSEAASSFTSPSGDVNASNATDLMNEALEASQNQNAVEGLFNSQPTRINPNVRALVEKYRKKENRLAVYGQSAEDCFKGDEENGEIDFGCLSAALGVDEDGCTYSGVVKFKITETESSFEFKNGFGADCPGTEDDFGCNGYIRAAYVDTFEIVCADLSCTSAGLTESVNACIRSDSAVLVSNVVCLALYPNTDCSTVCADWQDAGGILKVECTVDSTDTENPCPPSAAGILSVSDCTITEGVSCE